MSFSFFGTPVSSGIAIGRALVLSPSSHEVDHYYISESDKAQELNQLKTALQTLLKELTELQQKISQDSMPEVLAILEAHLMILDDAAFYNDIAHWVTSRNYNVEWALNTQIKIYLEQFEAMDDPYLKQRGSDLEQLGEQLLKKITQQKGEGTPAVHSTPYHPDPLIMVARDISPADMLHFQKEVFTGFITDIGGKTSHSAIIARSLSIPALVGTKNATHLIQQDDWLIIDTINGSVIVNPPRTILDEYTNRQKQHELEYEQLQRLKEFPSHTADQIPIELLINIEAPDDVQKISELGVDGVGLFRSEFLFINYSSRKRSLPTEEEQYLAYKAALSAAPECPIVIRTIDIGADKPLDYDSIKDTLNPALGQRAIRWSLAEPDIFLTQIRALLRASVHGNLQILIPMLSHEQQIRQTLAFIEVAKQSLREKGIPFKDPLIGAMIEVPAAALILPTFIRYFDFLSVGTNDLIQYTLAVDRADESVSELFDPLHPAILRLVANIIQECNQAGKKISICGEMAGDIELTKLLLGFGLRSFSMHPAHILSVKKEILQSHVQTLEPLALQVLQAHSIEEKQAALERLKETPISTLH